MTIPFIKYVITGSFCITGFVVGDVLFSFSSMMQKRLSTGNWNIGLYDENNDTGMRLMVRKAMGISGIIIGSIWAYRIIRNY